MLIYSDCILLFVQPDIVSSEDEEIIEDIRRLEDRYQWQVYYDAILKFFILILLRYFHVKASMKFMCQYSML